LILIGTTNIYLKNIANYKPDSVVLFEDGYHLSVFRVTPKNQSAYPVTQHLSVYLSEQPFNATIHGISTQKVYPWYTLPYTSVSTYLTFSPSPSLRISFSKITKNEGCNFLRHYLFPTSETRLLTGMLLYVVRTFLGIATAITRLQYREITTNSLN
jgi:hypothetical protein